MLASAPRFQLLVAQMKKIFFSLVAGVVVLNGCATKQETVTTTPTTTRSSSAKVKIINGKRYVFVPGELGSNIPGRWVPEDSPDAQAARQTGSIDTDTIRRTQEAPGQSLPGGN